MPNRSEKPDASRRNRPLVDRERLAREVARLDPKSEQAIADEGLSRHLDDWPEYWIDDTSLAKQAKSR